MIKNSVLLSLITFFTLFFTSCETDVEINADWEEITIVYGLLDQTDQDHYFRINKAYLGGNALEIAQIADSSSYNGALEVLLQGSLNGEIVQTIVFDTTTIFDKDSGIFYNPYMLIYKGSGQLQSNYLYTLKVRNTMSGKEVSANTRLIEEFNISTPALRIKVDFKRDKDKEFKWGNAQYALRYEPVIRFNYYEFASGSSDTIEKYIDWVLSTQFADDVSGDGLPKIEISNNDFYDFIKNNVKPAKIDGYRMCSTVDFIVTAGGEEYDTYLRVNGPSYSLVQDRPEYTNVENGFGLMSSRYTVSGNRRLHPFTEDEILLLKIKVEGEDVSLGFIPNPNL